MNAIYTFFNRLFFAVTCLLGWVVFPILILSGAAALLCYALIAELFSSVAERVETDRDQAVERSSDGRLCRPVHP